MCNRVILVIVTGIIGAWSAPGIAQDFGVPDTITIKPTTLAVGESRPVEIWLANDEAISGIQFTFLFAPLDSGFARLDSITG
mgnify:FL=1